MTVLVFPVYDKAEEFSPFQRIISLKDEAFVLRLDKRKAARKARKNCAHPASNNLIEGFNEWKFSLIEGGVFGDCEDNVWRVPFPQFDRDVTDEELVTRNRQAVLRIKVCEVREFASEFVAQSWV